MYDFKYYFVGIYRKTDESRVSFGKALIAAGIALSVNNGCYGCVTLEAKTTELAMHYYNAYHAIPLTSVGGPQRFMFDGDVSLAIISDYLTDSEKENL